jgi:hypothetical protein
VSLSVLSSNVGSCYQTTQTHKFWDNCLSVHRIAIACCSMEIAFPSLRALTTTPLWSSLY